MDILSTITTLLHQAGALVHEMTYLVREIGTLILAVGYLIQTWRWLRYTRWPGRG